MISKENLKSVGHHSQKFLEQKPFKYVVIDNFLDDSICNSLVEDFPVPVPADMINEYGGPSKKHTVSDISSLATTFQNLDQYIQSEEFLSYMKTLTGISDLLYDPGYFGGGTHNNLLGQGMNPHVDFNYLDIPGMGKVHRRVNAILYLNPKWEKSWGGNLELHSNPWEPDTDQVETVVPIKNRLVIFETNEYSWHGFHSVNDSIPDNTSRKSFAIYLYTKDRPAEEIAPPHGTTYVPELPIEKYVSGYTINDSDAEALKNMQRSCLHMTKGLYEKEHRLSHQNQIKDNALENYKKNMRLPIIGFARQLGSVSGFYAELLMEKKCSLKLESLVDISEIVFKIDPLDFIQKQSVRITVNNSVEKFSIDSTTKELTFKINIPKDSNMDVELFFSKAPRPIDEGVSSDLRALACRLIEINVQ
tara:strand:+ start:16542 stop:17795 length:1254 start_codon:yes stop_codon:yes gene_type:complete